MARRATTIRRVELAARSRHPTFSAIQASCSDGAVSSSSAVTGESSNHMVFAESVMGRSRTEKATRIVRAPDELMKQGFVLPPRHWYLGY
nr:hypothetical protein BgiMline_016301 [Biomphalaria glabrata]